MYVVTKTRYDRDKYIHCKNTLRTLTRKLRRDFEQNVVSMIKGKPKAFWKYTKSRLKSKPSIPSLSMPNGTKDKAETLNEFFSSVFTHEDLHEIPAASSYLVEEVISTIDVTPDLVREKLPIPDYKKITGA